MFSKNKTFLFPLIPGLEFLAFQLNFTIPLPLWASLLFNFLCSQIFFLAKSYSFVKVRLKAHFAWKETFWCCWSYIIFNTCFSLLAMVFCVSVTPHVTTAHPWKRWCLWDTDEASCSGPWSNLCLKCFMSSLWFLCTGLSYFLSTIITVLHIKVSQPARSLLLTLPVSSSGHSFPSLALYALHATRSRSKLTCPGKFFLINSLF